MKRKTLFGLAAGASALFCSVPAQAQEYYVGQILLVPYNFCPLGSADAAGQLMSISQNEVLFTLYGTTYGGNGQTTFGLPDLRGRAPLHVGQAPGCGTTSWVRRPGPNR
ncbi:MAG: tail fiber protein [Sphingomonas sp.]